MVAVSILETSLKYCSSRLPEEQQWDGDRQVVRPMATYHTE